MKLCKLMRPSMSAVAVLLTLADCNSPFEFGKSCTVVGCASPLALTMPLPDSFEEIRGLRLKVCHKADCFEETLDKLQGEAPVEPGSGIFVEFPDPETSEANKRGRVEAIVAADEPGFHLEVSYYMWDPNVGRDGEKFTATLTDASGAVVSSFTRRVKYKVSYPNGKDCASCRSAMLDPSDSG